jgi:geranylgeranyl transferase type-2 subunit beta
MANQYYLQTLTERLLAGLDRLPVGQRTPHIAFLHRAQNPDGGFSGRQGGSDLYYTGFALRSLAVFDALTPEIAERCAGYLRGCLNQQAGVVDFFSLLYSCMLVQLAGGPDALAASPVDWPERVADLLETFRTNDGGYGKLPGSASGSTYHSFLVALCYEMLGKPLPGPEKLAAFVQSRRREDGGFVEIAPMKRSGTNPTAAAVGVLQMLEGAVPAEQLATPEIADGVTSFLLEMRSDEGGLQANGRIPFADLLSTFTGAWTLHRLESLDQLDAGEVMAYVRGLEQPGGGFHGHLADEVVDVEYTFYGLGTLALLM